MRLILAYINRNGSHTTKHINGSKLGEELLKLYNRRIEAVAWITGDRANVVGRVFKNEGKWNYIFDADVEKP